MHTEHLENVRVGWIAAGWAVAVAVTSVIFIAFVAAGMVGVDTPTDAFWSAIALGLGFLAGGFFIGTRAVDAPILHGIGIGLASLVVWFVLNLASDLILTGGGEWAGLTPTATAALLLLQLFAAVAGAWIGRKRVLRAGEGAPG